MEFLAEVPFLKTATTDTVVMYMAQVGATWKKVEL
jgi:hypothetical protein